MAKAEFGITNNPRKKAEEGFTNEGNAFSSVCGSVQPILPVFTGL